MPTLAEIAASGPFTPVAIDAAAFEDVWRRAIAQHGPVHELESDSY